MAHVGRVYPLHFRRDIWIRGQRNQTALKRTYDVRWSSLIGDLATSNPGPYFRSTAIDETTAYPLLWQSDWTAHAGRSIRTVMRAGVEMALPPRQWGELSVEDSEEGLVIKFGGTMVSQFDSQQWLTSLILENPAPDLLRAGFGFGFMNCIAVKWDGTI